MDSAVFSPADQLIFNGSDPTAFSVVACDQYTSEPEYWEDTARLAAGKPSALHLIFPEVYLKSPDFENRVSTVNQNMEDALKQGIFTEYPDALIYLERTLRSGKIRRGLIGKIDLEAYDFSPGSQSPVRATEGTVLERIPPRVRIREQAPLELPHIMLLMDDRRREVLEPLAESKSRLQKLYGFPLMMGSGRLDGWLLGEEETARILALLKKMASHAEFDEKYGIPGKSPLPFAVGDGNHSLASARQHYLNCKEKLGEEAARRHPSRYALAELVNLHDESLEFEPIHRILTGVSPERLLEELNRAHPLSDTPIPSGQKLGILQNGQLREVWMTQPSRNLPVGTLQEFLDGYLAQNPGEIDYIHGAEVTASLSRQEQSIGFLLDGMDKNDLFPTVILDGALPRKTFSMGEAWDKRFYWEARKIR